MTLLSQDRDLLDAFRRGDRRALTIVYREYTGSLFGMLSKGFSIATGGNRFYFRGYRQSWQLEGAVQEVFVRAFSEKARNGYDGLRPYKNYLMTIARNYVVDSFRKNRRELLPLDDLPEQEEPGFGLGSGAPARDPETATEEKQLEVAVRGFIDSLDPPMMELFQARFQDGASVEDSAKKLGVSEYRIKRDEKRIRKDFFRHMRQNGYLEGYRYGDKGIETLTLSLLIVFGVGVSS